MTYFPVESIIGAEAFHFCVRDGNRWCHFARITRTLTLFNPIFSTFLKGELEGVNFKHCYFISKILVAKLDLLVRLSLIPYGTYTYRLSTL